VSMKSVFVLGLDLNCRRHCGERTSRQAPANLQAIAYPQAITTALADAGSCSEATLTEADPAGPELLIAPNKDWKQRTVLREQPGPRGRIPKRLSQRERMERMLLTTRGRRLYKKRGQTVEPVCGQIKRARGCNGFLRRGKAACDSEWTRLGATHYLLTRWRSGKTDWLGPCRHRAQRPFGRGNGQKTRRGPSRRPRSLAVSAASGPEGSTTNEFRVSNGFDHRFEQQARRCVHTVPRPTVFDSPVSDGRQLRK